MNMMSKLFFLTAFIFKLTVKDEETVIKEEKESIETLDEAQLI